jgi:predicted ATPase
VSSELKKYVITGAISVGKTTTLECLKAVFDVMNPMDRTLMNPGPKVAFTGEAATMVFQQYPRLDRTKFSTDLLIASQCILNERGAELTPDVEVIVCDRSVFDSLVFARAHAGGHYESLLKDPLVQEQLKSYTKFFLFDPRDVPYVTTEIRVEGSDFRTHLHETYLKMFEEFGLEWELISGPVSHRVVQMMERILKG